MIFNIRNILKEKESAVIIYDKLKQFHLKNFINDEKLIRKTFKKELNRELNLENSIRFNDKLQWLKLNWYDPFATKCADKYKVRKIVEEKIGKNYLNELIAVYERIEEINLDKLPESFVLKGTHGSGCNMIIRDKREENWNENFKIMRRWLRQNHYLEKREWVYRDIKPRIICEKLLEEDGFQNIIDYKFYCFNGKSKYCQVIRGRGEDETIDFYDEDWKHMPFNGMRNLPMSKEKYKKPKKYEEMLKLADILAGDFPFVRVDFYYVNEEIIFGELTFFPTSGFGKFYPDKYNEIIGNLIKLPKKGKKVQNEN